MDKAKVDVQRIKRQWSSFWRRSYKFTRCRVSRLFFFVTACCAVVTALIWYFALFDDLQVRILVSVVIVLIPMLDFQPPPRAWASREDLLWLSSFVALAVLLVAGDKFGWAGVALNSVVLLVALPYGWLVWKLMRRNGLLLVGLMLALAVMMIFWTAALVRDERSLDVLLLPLPSGTFLWRCLDTCGVAGGGHCRTMEEPESRRPWYACTGYGHPVLPGYAGCDGRTRDAGSQFNLVGCIPDTHGCSVKRGDFGTIETLPAGMGQPNARWGTSPQIVGQRQWKRHR